MPSVQARFAHTTSSRFQVEGSSSAPVLLMVSGGADSSALTLLAATSQLDLEDGRGCAPIAKERLHILHVNHGLRGASAQADEEFVQELASHFGIVFHVAHVDIARLAAQKSLSGEKNIENVGRMVRYKVAYELIKKLCHQTHTRVQDARILTAHTASDRVETFFLNATKGSALSGLCSIPRRRGIIVRPLLDATHEELCDMLTQHGMTWCEDQTNHDTHYARAYMRHVIVPKLKEKNPRLIERICSTCDILRDENNYMDNVAHRHLESLIRRKTESVLVLDALRLSSEDVALARRMVRLALMQMACDIRLDTAHIEAILRCVAAGIGSLSLASSLSVRVEHGLLFIRLTSHKEALRPAWMRVLGTFSCTRNALPYVLSARVYACPAHMQPEDFAQKLAQRTQGTHIVCDAEKLGFALDSRPSLQGAMLWVDSAQPADVMCPFGMSGRSKKISDLLNEAHIPLEERPLIPIVRQAPEGKIVWVASIRSDERFRCTPRTTVMLELSFTPAK